MFTQKFFWAISIIYHSKQTKFKLKMAGISSAYRSILSTYQKQTIHLILKSCRHFLNMIQKMEYLPKFFILKRAINIYSHFRTQYYIFIQRLQHILYLFTILAGKTIIPLKIIYKILNPFFLIGCKNN